jgi:hypothetical protein
MTVVDVNRQRLVLLGSVAAGQIFQAGRRGEPDSELPPASVTLRMALFAPRWHSNCVANLALSRAFEMTDLTSQSVPAALDISMWPRFERKRSSCSLRSCDLVRKSASSHEHIMVNCPSCLHRRVML